MNNDSAEALTGFTRVVVRPNIVLETLRSASRPTDRLPVALFAGRPLEWKGIRLLIRSRQLAKEQWTLELCGGSAEEFSEFGDVTAEGVRVRGRVARNELLQRLGEVSCVVLPSVHDSAGWIAAEAAAMGTPVVCLDIGGVEMMAGGFASVVEALPAETLTARIAARIDLLTTGAHNVSGPSPDWTELSYRRELAKWYQL
ncbi:glycosyltransferase [Microbacterium sp. NPDC089189]|uniref:glycosyltransferase n=1 Tax=Microbacterium sp. NPDC089189 TaxID=3154972 RepID=UPI00341C62A6